MLYTTFIDGVFHFAGKSIVSESMIDPETLGLSISKRSDLVANDLEEATVFVRDAVTGVLSGGVRDMVVINVALGLFLADRVQDLSEGVLLAKETIDSGRANETLLNWAKISYST